MVDFTQFVSNEMQNPYHRFDKIITGLMVLSWVLSFHSSPKPCESTAFGLTATLALAVAKWGPEL